MTLQKTHELESRADETLTKEETGKASEEKKFSKKIETPQSDDVVHDDDKIHDTTKERHEEMSSTRSLNLPTSSKEINHGCDGKQLTSINLIKQNLIKRSLRSGDVKPPLAKKLCPAMQTRSNALMKRENTILISDSEDEKSNDTEKGELRVNQVRVSTHSLLSIPGWNSGKYMTICNVAFSKLRYGFIYKCLINGCRFQSLVKESLLIHLNSKHSEQVWSGFCSICTKIVVGHGNELKMEDEFSHMDEHVEFFTAESQTATLVMNMKSVADTIRSNTSYAFKDLNLSTSIQVTPISSSLTSKSLPEKPSESRSTRKVTIRRSTVSETSAHAAQQANRTSELQKVEQKSCRIKNELRPWIETKASNKKSPELVKAMQTNQALCATYKCMSSLCSFFTIDVGIFQQHLSLHVQYTTLDKENFLLCSYCDFKGMSIEHLIKHFEVHIYDRYQCNYCFYRSCSDFNVLTHENNFHKGEAIVILEFPERKARDMRSEMKDAVICRKKNVPPIICVFCRGLFFPLKAFKRHLENHSEKSKAKCIKCCSTVTKMTLPDHLHQCLNFGLYQCIYCVFGTNLFTQLHQHVANDHPSKLPLFCARVEQTSPDGTLKHVRLKILLFQLIYLIFISSQPSPSVVETTFLKRISHVVQKENIVKKSLNSSVLKNIENMGKIKEGLIIQKDTDVKRKSPRIVAEASGVCQKKIRAQMPCKASKSTPQMKLMLKPLAARKKRF